MSHRTVAQVRRCVTYSECVEVLTFHVIEFLRLATFLKDYST